MKYKIDKNIPLPLYYQLKQVIMTSIEDGIFKENEAIPTEFELINTYALSRTTVRQALNELVNEGYLYRKKGVGTFVTPISKMRDQQDAMNSTIYKIDKVINRNGFICETKFLGCGVLQASADIASHLEIQVNDDVWYLDRVRYAGNKAASFSRSYIDKRLISTFEEDAKEACQNFHDYLDSKGLVITTIRERLIPGVPDNGVKEVLELDSEKPIMIIENVGYMQDGKVVEYSVSTLDVSFIDFYATFKRG